MVTESTNRDVVSELVRQSFQPIAQLDIIILKLLPTRKETKSLIRDVKDQIQISEVFYHCRIFSSQSTSAWTQKELRSEENLVSIDALVGILPGSGLPGVSGSFSMGHNFRLPFWPRLFIRIFKKRKE